MMKSLMAVLVAVSIAACAPAVMETRMIHAPAREANCALQFAQVDIASSSFNSTWDVLGYVALLKASPDPMADENRTIVRGRACAMGGTTIAVAMSATTTSPMGGGSSLSYMVLRPKSAPVAPTAF